jgi:hypothetical protein
MQYPRELVQIYRVALARLCYLDYGVNLGWRKVESLPKHPFQMSRFFRTLLAVCLCAVREQRRTRNLDLVSIESLVLAFVQNAIEEAFDLAKHRPIQLSACRSAEGTLLEADRCISGTRNHLL